MLYLVPRSGLEARFENGLDVVKLGPLGILNGELVKAEVFLPNSGCCCMPCCEWGRSGCVDPPVDGREDGVALGVDANMGIFRGVSDDLRRSWRDLVLYESAPGCATAGRVGEWGGEAGSGAPAWPTRP